MTTGLLELMNHYINYSIESFPSLHGPQSTTRRESRPFFTFPSRHDINHQNASSVPPSNTHSREKTHQPPPTSLTHLSTLLIKDSGIPPKRTYTISAYNSRKVDQLTQSEPFRLLNLLNLITFTFEIIPGLLFIYKHEKDKEKTRGIRTACCGWCS